MKRGEFSFRRLLPDTQRVAPEILRGDAATLWAAGRRGRGATVLVIDTGAPMWRRPLARKPSIHPDLEGALRIADCRSFVPHEPENFDFNGHGTAVCGIIAARDNRFGIVGYAPECEIVCFKAADRTGHGESAWLRAALDAAAELRPDAVSISLGMPNGTHILVKPLRRLRELGVAVFAGAGNNGPDAKMDAPARMDGVVSVGALGKDGEIAPFSSGGRAADELFPGEGIYTTWLRGGYAEVSGTSFATPAAAAMEALMRGEQDETMEEKA